MESVKATLLNPPTLLEEEGYLTCLAGSIIFHAPFEYQYDHVDHNDWPDPNIAFIVFLMLATCAARNTAAGSA